ncbi:hypothetical protein A2956_02470 [Candidatus Roizmanbacteria bacterium RIFCSPLOWO2_01_FULL_37_57]|nr:MAG: hypothetical protein A2956_02470 [Candidatus Roizmanbacteria bacterium RIFCSPLOWO2_01_FULL_37_57]
MNNNSIYKEVINEFGTNPAQTFLENQERERKKIINRIQDFRKKESGRETRVIIYYAKLDFPFAHEVMINQWDIKSVYSILMEIEDNVDLEVVINTRGGLPQKTRQIIEFLRNKLGKKNKLRVVVPEIAKSAGTIICLGADIISVGPPSELGPIDPQVPRTGIGGHPEYLSAWTYVNSYKMLMDNCKNEDGSLKVEYYPLLANFDLPFYEQCKQAISQIETDAKELLQEGMYAQKANEIDGVVEYFLGGGRPHDVLINSRQLVQKLGKKNVEYLTENNTIWKLYWELHCRVSTLMSNTPIVKIVEYMKGNLNRQINLSQAQPNK